MRIVLDTNVALSALLWRGTPYSLLRAARQQAHVQLFSSEALLSELIEVLVRPFPAKRLALIGLSSHEVLADYIDTIELVVPSSVPRVVMTDPDDDEVVAAAIAADADLIVSGDGDLLSLESYGRIRILRPIEAIQQLGIS